MGKLTKDDLRTFGLTVLGMGIGFLAISFAVVDAISSDQAEYDTVRAERSAKCEAHAWPKPFYCVPEDQTHGN